VVFLSFFHSELLRQSCLLPYLRRHSQGDRYTLATTLNSTRSTLMKVNEVDRVALPRRRRRHRVVVEDRSVAPV